MPASSDTILSECIKVFLLLECPGTCCWWGSAPRPAIRWLRRGVTPEGQLWMSFQHRRWLETTILNRLGHFADEWRSLRRIRTLVVTHGGNHWRWSGGGPTMRIDQQLDIGGRPPILCSRASTALRRSRWRRSCSGRRGAAPRVHWQCRENQGFRACEILNMIDVRLLERRGLLVWREGVWVWFFTHGWDPYPTRAKAGTCTCIFSHSQVTHRVFEIKLYFCF
jgi:hypothetical protein